jgi:chloride channel 3/4/5
MIAATALKLMDPFGTGKTVLFEVTYDRDWHFAELIGERNDFWFRMGIFDWRMFTCHLKGFVGLGIFGGVYGALFCKGNIAWAKNVRNGTWLRAHPIVEVILVTGFTVVVSFFNPFTK